MLPQIPFGKHIVTWDHLPHTVIIKLPLDPSNQVVRSECFQLDALRGQKLDLVFSGAALAQTIAHTCDALSILNGLALKKSLTLLLHQAIEAWLAGRACSG